MYLSKVKLSGFKSFVDHTVFELTGRLNGIVGPNGCGKSNIIDAIRWVMGESSAKQLRGEAMTDVIFSGATSRKASSFASIELVFDNTDGKIGGQWAAFTEISIKRVLERSGQSTYFLNGAKCRRKDITDIFLGTGLGSRSYAIIEQGMISRVVESKAEELRLVFEEAASVSKYKEQKKETETRIEHTRQNLLRLLDVREELNKQLEHLEKQAKKAEEFQVLKKEERLLQYISLKQKRTNIEQEKHDISERIESLQKEFHETVNFYNDLIVKYNANKLALVEKGQKLSHHIEHYHEQQKVILNLQHKLESMRTLQSSATQDCNDLQLQLQTVDEEYCVGEVQLETLSEDQNDKRDSLSVLNESLLTFNETLSELQHMIDECLANVKRLNEDIRELERQADIAKNNITHFETKQINDEALIAKLTTELDELLRNDLNREQDSVLSEQIIEKNLELDELTEHLLTHTEKQSELDSRKLLLEQAIHQNLRKESEYQGRLSALALLQNALVAQEEQIEPLYNELVIDSGWQKAAEIVLSKFLTLSIHKNGRGYISGENAFEFTPQHLGFYIQSPLKLGSVLSHVYVAHSTQEAEEQRQSLKMHECIVLSNGDLYGVDWFISHDQQEIQGVLERAEEISQLEIQLEQLIQTIQQQQDELQSVDALIENNKIDVMNAEHSVKDVKEILHSLEKELAVLRKERAHITENQQRIEKELSALKTAHEEGQLVIEENRMSLESTLALLDEHKINHHALEGRLQDYEGQKKIKLSEQQTLVQTINQNTRDLDAVSFKIKEIQTNLERLKASKAQLTQKLHEKTAVLTNDDEMAMLEEELMIHHSTLLELEHEKDELSESVDVLQASITQDEQFKDTQEKHINSQKEMIQSLMLREAEFKAHEEHVLNNWETLLESLSEEEQVSLSQEMLTLDDLKIDELLKTVQSKLSRIGAVNLIAIEECKALNERKTYLDEQDRDLNQALLELETAINKIDQETRDRFMETFNAVNADFSKLFPRLFGGGEAYLELKGDDVLSSGVNIIARPPGKKPGTIHLLSGGEKALTAAALVFAIFNLNPAPFCILDEVDAPLDEANVRRLGTLLQEMSDKVQFIFITHNKTTMSIAESLIGVTMSEPGVSRLVSVDLAEAEKIIHT